MKTCLRWTTCFIAIFSFFLLSSHSANSQQLPFASNVTLTASTDSPMPGQKITISAKSYSANLDSSKITWTVDGKVAKSGIGATSLEITAPALGKKMAVKFLAVTTDNVSISDSVTINASFIDVIVETDGYVPPFFKGKLPIIYQNAVTVIAIPHITDSSGAEIDPKNLVYQWKKNSRTIEDQSGYGKQSITLIGDIVPRPYSLSVTATSRDGNFSAEAVVNISAKSPTIGFYVDDPLYGPMFNQAISGIINIGSEKETGVLAVPYGFNVRKNHPDELSLTWLINEIKNSELDSNMSIVLRAPEGQTGNSAVSLDVRNTKNILQGAKSNFLVRFTENKDTVSNADNTVNF